jgi:SAM-dependent methyltransferase
MFSLEGLHQIRDAEMDAVVSCFPPGARVLEIGAGTGYQALAIKQRGFEVEAIDLPQSNYTQDRLFPITDYDGRHIPFPDASFDVVFSSNVLEHVVELAPLQAEIKRVLRPGGSCLHLLPTHAWRFWTILSAFPAGLQKLWSMRSELVPRRGPPLRELRRLSGALYRAARHLLSPLFPTRHGEAGTAVSELWLFHPRRWRKSFRRDGFEIVRDRPMGLFYTGHLVLGGRTSIAQRTRMAGLLGSACHLFELRASSRSPGAAKDLPG